MRRSMLVVMSRSTLINALSVTCKFRIQIEDRLRVKSGIEKRTEHEPTVSRIQNQ